MTDLAAKPGPDAANAPAAAPPRVGRTPAGGEGRHLAHLDGWRGLAISLVLLGHFWVDAVLPGTSTLGVDLFFVLSGRLMAEILFVQHTPLAPFFGRRFSRVYPALAVYVLATTVLFWFTPYRHGLVAAVSALTFTINYAMVYAHRVAVLDHLWSLCVEEHGYAILAVVALVVRRWSAPAALVVGGLGLAALLNGVLQSIYVGQDVFDLFARTDVSVAGLFLAGALHLVLRDRARGWSPLVAPAALAAGVAVKLFAPETALRFGLGMPLLALAVATIDTSPPVLRRLLSLPWMTQVGLWSFSLYLWQQPFYKMAHDGGPKGLLFATACLAALASFYGVERPARRRLNAWIAQATPKPAP